MTSRSAYTLPPIDAGDVFTCKGTGLLYEGIPRVPLEELRKLLASGSGQVLGDGRKEPKKWFQAQSAHYGLPTTGIVASLRTQLNTLLSSPTARIPEALAQLETEKNDEYRALNERIKSITSRARSPTPGRARRVTMSNVPDSEPASSPAPVSSVKAPRPRTTSTGPPSRARTKSIEPEPELEPPTKRGRGRPRKSEPAPTAHPRDGSATSTERVPSVRNLKEKAKGKRNSHESETNGAKRPDPPSQNDSTISAYSDLDDETMEALDEIETGMELLGTDADGDSQMDPPVPYPSSPPPASSLPAHPQTPRRVHHISFTSPSTNSPKSALVQDVVSGMWSLRVVLHTSQLPTPPQGGQPTNTGVSGSMNLHLSEDKRSLVGDFSLLGMDGVVKSKTLEGRADGAYARLLFVGQMGIEETEGKEREALNKVFGPSPLQSGYLRFSDGRKGKDGRFTLKGALHGGGYGKVDFEGVRDGEEQELCAKWDDFD